MERARLVGINHVALEVGDLDEALAFYGRVFELRPRGRVGGMAFVDIGDQFLALAGGREQSADGERHLGLVVDDREAARRALEEAGAEILPGRGLDFLDPWGNHVQVVEYGDVQFAKTPAVLAALGLEGLEKSERARAELREKGLAAEPSPVRLVEFPVDEPERARRFWENLLGIELEERRAGEGQGWQTRAEGAVLGVHARGAGPGDRVSLPYLEVADLEAALGRVVELGGSVVHPGGRWAICRDSEGSPFGLARRG